ncbi:PREDICTED: uncharacterized protein LOC106792583 [Polistes canadensis]|uniref:uncharacterized protein LOC106792583 n=1 Tax=Polistes canadensis TaxID=91411 RepID=UPI0007190225|nr:PREDICTED: uncharacterized protein LOC106792583 [Polistes canadensis]
MLARPSGGEQPFVEVIPKSKIKKAQAALRTEAEKAAAGPGVKGPSVASAVAAVKKVVQGRQMVRGIAERNRPREEAVVSVTCRERASYKGVLVKTSEIVNLKEVGIDGFRIHRRVTGAFILELRGGKARGKAEKLARALGLVLLEAKVSLPTRIRDFLLCGLDARVTRGEVITAVTGFVLGAYSRFVRVGEICPGRGRLGQVYVSAPESVARCTVNNGSILIGWSWARVIALGKRPFRCFKCMAREHVAARCRSAAATLGLCFRCGESGHVAASCGRKPCYLVCRDTCKSTFNHVVGSMGCLPVPARKRLLIDRISLLNSLTIAGAGNSLAEGMDVEVSAVVPQDCRDSASASGGGAIRTL